MPIEQVIGTVQYALDLVGIFAFALTGALLAVRKDFDIFGTFIMAEIAGLGGGLFRDLVIDAKPVAFTDAGFYLVPLAAAVIVFFSTTLQRHERICDVFDAVALGLFSVSGTIKALAHDFGAGPAAALGIATAVGGGVLCSVVAREVPPLLRWDQNLYALPALIGAGAVVALHRAEVLSAVTAVAAATLACTVRLLAIRRRWRTPRSRAWRQGNGRHGAATPTPAPSEAVASRVPTVVPHPLHEDTLRIRLPELHTGPYRNGTGPAPRRPEEPASRAGSSRPARRGARHARRAPLEDPRAAWTARSAAD